MIHSLIITNHVGKTLEIDLRRPAMSGFAINDITGIGPGKSNVSISEFSTINGGMFNSSRIPSRTININLIFYGVDIENLRHKSYEFFPLNKQIMLRFVTDERDLKIYGIVNTNEPKIFSKSEGATISVSCPNPNFTTYEEESINFSGVVNAFEFPFSNESLTDNLIEFSTVDKMEEHVLVYEGDQDTGLVFRITNTGDAPIRFNITLYNSTTNEMFKLRTYAPLLSSHILNMGLKKGDVIEISTEKGNKHATLEYVTYDGYLKKYNILDVIDPSSSWFGIVHGDNILSFDAKDERGEDIPVERKAYLSITVSNKVLYLGV